MALAPMAIKAKTGFSLKDQLFNARSVGVLSDALAKSINVRQGKFIELELSETDTEVARARVTDMCEKLLANTVIENYAIEIADA